MEPMQTGLLALAIGVVAFLYSSVGHAGASGYIAVLTLWSVATPDIKPTALVLNILVASVGAFQFWRAGHFAWPLFWPFAVLSVPMAWLGASWRVPSAAFKPLLGMVLLFSAVRLWLRSSEPLAVAPPSRPLALGVGAGIGLLSGLTGTGGGIFLTPLLLFCGWARTHTAAAVSVVFIWVNSAAGLGGHLSSGQTVPKLAWLLAGVALAGGALGSHLGSRKLPARPIQLLLAVVLVIAGNKLLFTK